jgi:hypothetical protein
VAARAHGARSVRSSCGASVYAILVQNKSKIFYSFDFQEKVGKVPAQKLQMRMN